MLSYWARSLPGICAWHQTSFLVPFFMALLTLSKKSTSKQGKRSCAMPAWQVISQELWKTQSKVCLTWSCTSQNASLYRAPQNREVPSIKQQPSATLKFKFMFSLVKMSENVKDNSSKRGYYILFSFKVRSKKLYQLFLSFPFLLG